MPLQNSIYLTFLFKSGEEKKFTGFVFHLLFMIKLSNVKRITYMYRWRCIIFKSQFRGHQSSSSTKGALKSSHPTVIVIVVSVLRKAYFRLFLVLLLEVEVVQILGQARG